MTSLDASQEGGNQAAPATAPATALEPATAPAAEGIPPAKLQAQGGPIVRYEMLPTSPLINRAMVAIMADVDPIAKERKNPQGYTFRGIDDVYIALQAIMARHGVFTTSEILEARTEERSTQKGTALIYRLYKIRYWFNALDGSKIWTDVPGEASDSNDKASNKAMSAAHKYALLQVFCIPTSDPKDTENHSDDAAAKHPAERAHQQAQRQHGGGGQQRGGGGHQQRQGGGGGASGGGGGGQQRQGGGGGNQQRQGGPQNWIFKREQRQIDYMTKAMERLGVPRDMWQEIDRRMFNRNINQLTNVCEEVKRHAQNSNGNRSDANSGPAENAGGQSR